ncbi:hypothetical protein QBC47DRAFT_353950 [Echria macrotheca]|uniref:Uncharacterized protein n=1 Tax=Echria macrotheca TaxID=438768 RepID=A0AAJ0F6F5_9PEZI|nr:hypothetical protein QBC47DRAFT_353950 [Echria macrotheca]
MRLAALLAASSLLGASAVAAGRRPCGFKIAPCPGGQTCEKVDASCARGENCEGYCLPAKTTLRTVTTTATATPTPTTTSKPARETYQSCGGFRVQPYECPAGFLCVDDPYVKGCGMACDRPGICVPEKAPFCGGFAGFACKDGKICIDHPGDGCDPQNGGADCGGICV